jgi:tRNA(Ile)-lysidine synthetase-like protein
MRVELEKPGTYVIAVSGGVDSMALLDLLVESITEKQKLVVAHVDHGMRPDSAEDRKLVEKTAKALNLDFEYLEARLGPNASEETAREVRYKFLYHIKDKYKAEAIITAHHEDDLIETAIINLIRGTSRKGMSSLSSREGIIRPLLTYPKAELIKYAKSSKLVWREDSTNSDTSYLRNYVRLNIVPRLDTSAKSKLVGILHKSSSVNSELDNILLNMLSNQSQPGTIDRLWFISLPHNMSREIMAMWFRMNSVSGFDRRSLERLVVSAKTASDNQRFPIKHGYHLLVKRQSLALEGPER